MSKESMFDSRLFNQSEGISSGFRGGDDEGNFFVYMIESKYGISLTLQFLFCSIQSLRQEIVCWRIFLNLPSKDGS
jgi:hypothetical protein